MEYRSLALPLLIESCVTKDPLAWAEFMRRFSPLVTLAIKRALPPQGPPEEDIKDIRQDIMTSLWRRNKLSEVKNRDNINYWLAITSRNAAINHMKAKRKEILSDDTSCFERLPAGCADGKTERGTPEELNEKIKKIYNLLSTREKLIFKLHFRSGMNLREISEIIGEPLGTVSSAVTRMRRKIKCSKI